MLISKTGKTKPETDQLFVAELRHNKCLILLQSGSDWPQMEHIRDFFRSDFSTFWLGQNVLKSDLKKSRICLIWGANLVSDPPWSQIRHPL